MIEVVHFQNRYGRQLIGVFSPEINSMSRSPAAVEYAQRYAAGLEPAYYALPVTMVDTYAFAIQHVIQLMAELFDTEGP